MVRPLWKLLLENPSKLDCDECSVVLEYYSDLMFQGGPGLLPVVIEHLQGCPDCRIKHQETLHRLESVYQKEQNGASK